MELFFRKLGEGKEAIIILHGLYGSSDNWLPIGRKLSEKHSVYLIDQRNHGKSPHSPKHNYYLLREDLKDFMDTHKIQKATIIGHSMGGKTAMFFAEKYPEYINRLIVVDISPKSYKNKDIHEAQDIDHISIIQTLNNLNLDEVKNYNDIEDYLVSKLKSIRISQFLLKNVQKKEGKFSWKLNLNTISLELNSIKDGFSKDEIESFQGITDFQTLFIKGANSNYILEEDFRLIKKMFPYSKIEIIENAGHWVHAEQFEEFLNVLNSFID